MFKTIKKQLKNEKGLTLVELLAVIVILGIIAAIAIPAIGNIIDNSRAKAVLADGMNALNAANIYYIENPKAESPVTVAVLETEGFLESKGTLSTSTSITKADGKSNTISGDGVSGSKTINIPGKTLDQLANATVKKGEVTWEE